jgi:hypothetical protein
MKELSTVNKLMMFLFIDDDGRVVLKEEDLQYAVKKLWNSESVKIDPSFPSDKYLMLLAYHLKELNDDELDEFLKKFIGLKDWCQVKETLINIYSKFNIQ